MKAAVYHKYGPPEVLQIEEVPKPEPKDNEILVEVYAATVTAGDVRLRASDFPALFWLPARMIFGLFRPKKKILGHEFSGTVKKVGKKVKRFNLEDQVFGSTTMLKAGSYAQYVCIPEKWKHGVVHHKPTKLDFSQSAALPIGGMTALFLLEKARIETGQKILIYGASGSVGSYAIQVGKNYGTEVTAVCSGANTEMVQSLGADQTYDYKTQSLKQIPERFDIVFDAVGKIKKSVAKGLMKKNGTFVSVEMITQEKFAHLKQLWEWAEEGSLRPYIDKTYALDQIVEAHRYVDTGRKKGNVVIEINRSKEAPLKEMEAEKEEETPAGKALKGVYESEIVYSDDQKPGTLQKV